MLRLYCLTKSDVYYNQRTNGPVNAHLRPEIYTCTDKLVRLEWYNARVHVYNPRAGSE